MPTRAGPLFVGLDAMDAALVHSLVRAGRLPVLASLLDGWDRARTVNPPGLVVGGLWPTFWSGAGPGHHGSYCFRQVVPGGWETEELVPEDFDTEPFWLALDRDGFRCTVFDVPLVRPVILEHGRVIGDWGTHDRQLDMGCRPAAVGDLVARVGGNHPIDGGRCDTMVEEHGYARLYEALLDGVDRRTDVLLRLLEEPDDLLLAVFSESHCAGHHFWHLHDRRDPRHDALLADELDGDPLARVYERVDAALGTVLDAAGDRPAMVLLSHGVGPHNDGNHLLDELLARIERAHFGRTSVAVRTRAKLVPYARAVGRHARRRTGWGPQPVPRNIGLLDGSRRWYSIPNNDLYGGIRLNLAGREPFGLVHQADVDAVYELLRDELLRVRNDVTGRRAIRAVIRTDDHHDGPNRARLPDLLVAWDWSVPVTSLSSPTVGSLQGASTPARTGDHRPPGLVLTRGLPPLDARRIPVEQLGPWLASTVRAGQGAMARAQPPEGASMP